MWHISAYFDCNFHAATKIGFLTRLNRFWQNYLENTERMNWRFFRARNVQRISRHFFRSGDQFLDLIELVKWKFNFISTTNGTGAWCIFTIQISFALCEFRHRSSHKCTIHSNLKILFIFADQSTFRFMIDLESATKIYLSHVVLVIFLCFWFIYISSWDSCNLSRKEIVPRLQCQMTIDIVTPTFVYKTAIWGARFANRR